jgi:hypothetical protein
LPTSLKDQAGANRTLPQGERRRSVEVQAPIPSPLAREGFAS